MEIHIIMLNLNKFGSKDFTEILEFYANEFSKILKIEKDDVWKVLDPESLIEILKSKKIVFSKDNKLPEVVLIESERNDDRFISCTVIPECKLALKIDGKLNFIEPQKIEKTKFIQKIDYLIDNLNVEKYYKVWGKLNSCNFLEPKGHLETVMSEFPLEVFKESKICKFNFTITGLKLRNILTVLMEFIIEQYYKSKNLLELLALNGYEQKVFENPCEVTLLYKINGDGYSGILDMKYFLKDKDKNTTILDPEISFLIGEIMNRELPYQVVEQLNWKIVD